MFDDRQWCSCLHAARSCCSTLRVSVDDTTAPTEDGKRSSKYHNCIRHDAFCRGFGTTFPLRDHGAGTGQGRVEAAAKKWIKHKQGSVTQHTASLFQVNKMCCSVSNITRSFTLTEPFNAAPRGLHSCPPHLTGVCCCSTFSATP